MTQAAQTLRERAIAIQQARAQVLNAMPVLANKARIARQVTPVEAVVLDAGERLQAQGCLCIYMQAGTGEFTGVEVWTQAEG